jgi:tripartite-type tricarboxylate transporter receptor subunit TctC
MNRREILQVSLGVVSAAALPSGALAQAKFPERPIKLVIPFAPGGVTDIVGRHWAERMKAGLGTIFIENQGGAAGTVGATQVARSDADGHTMLLGNTSVIVLNPLTKPNLSYDPAKDFVPIGILCVATVALVVNAAVPVKTLKEFVDYVKANPGKVSYGSAGAGTMTHLAAEQFKLMTGLKDLTHVPYKGAGPGIADLVSGHIPAMTPNITSQVLGHQQAGKVRVLAVFSPKRLKGAPDVPTAIELGFPNMVGQLFVGVFVRSGTPKAVLDQMAATNQKVMADAEFQKILVNSGLEPINDTPAEASKFIAEEQARWAPVVKAIGLKVG